MPPETSKIVTKNNIPAARKGRRRYLRWLLLAAGLGLNGTIAVVAGVIGAYYYVAPGLPPAETIREIPLQIPLRIFSRDGHLIEEVGERRRILINYDDLPQHVIDAFIAAEDRRFFVHPGVDYQGILRALLLLIKTGEISGGGSTLTQQLARDYFLSREQVFTRKLREAFLAYKIEQEFSNGISRMVSAGGRCHWRLLLRGAGAAAGRNHSRNSVADSAQNLQSGRTPYRRGRRTPAHTD